ncbi:MarR family transcriptional regulator [Actinoplanes rectilineatus]|uniref:MarR family transcriptional regulator n=1 Tax=Actinoplanes rectilineatus TaxID=113571 RepID=UPI0009FAC233
MPADSGPDAPDTTRPDDDLRADGENAGQEKAGEENAGRENAGEENLVEAFWAVARRLRHGTRVALEPWSISPSQSRALGVLIRHGEMRLSSLADHLRIAPRSATEVVDGLQELDLVERRPDPADRRAVLVVPTPHGRSTADAIHRARAAEGERLFATLTPADRADLSRVLRKLHD